MIADKAKKKKAQESQLLSTARKNLDLTVSLIQHLSARVLN